MPEMSVVDNWLEERRQRGERASQNMALAWPVLKEAGITSVVLTYYGSGDSGGMETGELHKGEGEEAISFSTGGEWPEFLPRIMATRDGGRWDPVSGAWAPAKFEGQVHVLELLTEIADDFLSSEHGGWENNEGGQGTVVFDVEEQTATLNHEEFVVESIHSQHTWS